MFLNVVSFYKFNYNIIAHRFNAKLIEIVSCIYNVYVQPLLLRENYDTLRNIQEIKEIYKEKCKIDFFSFTEQDCV